MSLQMNLWQITDGKIGEIPPIPLDAEQRLEKWIIEDPSILGLEMFNYR